MKYKDKTFIKYQEKQRDGEVGIWSQKSERQIRREREHRFTIFYQKNLIGKIDKYWWNNLKESDREKIVSLYSLQEDAISSEWFDYIKTTFIPNRIQLREDKLKKLGI